MMSESKPLKRKGSTTVTSVSVSNEFMTLINQYNISPTECFRKGVAVTLFDLGVSMYQSTKNEERSKFMHEYIKKVEEDEKEKDLAEDIEKFKELTAQLKRIQSGLFDITLKWTTEDLKNEQPKQ